MKIPLTRGQYAVIDDEDCLTVLWHNWHAVKTSSGWYARSWINGKEVHLHRFLMQCKKGVIIDHRDGNGLNCQRNNIRVATRQQNIWNSRKRKNSNSRYKGVWKSLKKWRAYLKDGKRRINLGTFTTQEQAAMAYDRAAKKVCGEFARLNF